MPVGWGHGGVRVITGGVIVVKGAVWYCATFAIADLNRERLMRRVSVVPLTLAVVVACSQGSEPTVEQEVQLVEAAPGLLARATVTPEAARATALERVAGTIIEAELEEEGGVLMYSFEVRGTDGTVTEVEIDAGSGAVLNVEVEHDGPDDDGPGDDGEDDDGEDPDAR